MKHPVFLFGTGRCGSTLIQRAINCHEDIVMWGEHEGFLGPLARSMKLILEGPSVTKYVYGDWALKPSIVKGPLKKVKEDICWINDFTPGQVEDAYRQMILDILCRNLELEKVHWGFKEIRYRQGQPVFWMLKKLFPEARFLFVFRHPVGTTASVILAWRRGELESLCSDSARREHVREVALRHLNGWYEKNRFLWNFTQKNPGVSHVMRYEDWRGDGESEARRMFDWLGMDYPERVKKVVKNRVAVTSTDPLRSLIEEEVRNTLRETDPEVREFMRTLNYELE